MYKLRKKLVASKDLKSGMILTKSDIAIKIPGDGTPPHQLDLFIGEKLNKSILKDESLNIDHIN